MHLKNLIYGFGFYPTSVDINLKRLGRENAETINALRALLDFTKKICIGYKWQKIQSTQYWIM